MAQKIIDAFFQKKVDKYGREWMLISSDVLEEFISKYLVYDNTVVLDDVQSNDQQTAEDLDRECMLVSAITTHLNFIGRNLGSNPLIVVEHLSYAQNASRDLYGLLNERRQNGRG